MNNSVGLVLCSVAVSITRIIISPQQPRKYGGFPATKPYLVSCTFYRRGFYRRGYGSALQISKCDVKHYSDVLMPFQPIGLRKGATAVDSCDNTDTVHNMEASSALDELY